MLLRLYKYNLPTNARLNGGMIQMPKGAQILSVQAQRDTPVAWAIVDLDAPMVMREFELVLTGQHMPANIKDMPFLGTIQLNEGETVLHYFDGGEQPL